MGAIQGLFKAQYDVLRAKGHSPSEAFSMFIIIFYCMLYLINKHVHSFFTLLLFIDETVEEATQSLYPLIGKNGMDWMYANCSTTAQRGALDWWGKFCMYILCYI